MILVIPPTLGLKGSGAFYTCERKVARRLVGKGTFCPPPKKIIWRDLKRKAFVFFAAFVWGWGGGRDGKIAQVGEGSFLELHSMRKRQDFAFDFYLIRFTPWDPNNLRSGRRQTIFSKRFLDMSSWFDQKLDFSKRILAVNSRFFFKFNSLLYMSQSLFYMKVIWNTPWKTSNSVFYLQSC